MVQGSPPLFAGLDAVDLEPHQRIPAPAQHGNGNDFECDAVKFKEAPDERAGRNPFQEDADAGKRHVLHSAFQDGAMGFDQAEVPAVKPNHVAPIPPETTPGSDQCLSEGVKAAANAWLKTVGVFPIIGIPVNLVDQGFPGRFVQFVEL